MSVTNGHFQISQMTRMALWCVLYDNTCVLEGAGFQLFATTWDWLLFIFIKVDILQKPSFGIALIRKPCYCSIRFKYINSQHFQAPWGEKCSQLVNIIK